MVHRWFFGSVNHNWSRRTFSFCHHVFSVDDSSSGRQPLHLVGLDHAAFIAIVDCAINNERHRFESRVRVRPAHRAVANVEMCVPQHNERIVKGEIFRRHDLRCQVSMTSKSGRK